ncbi:2880_t:CDS:2 [Racocetra fulgida]|uniref:2880_t:CDS:1 n=1 Tax=Racocetra fulgida TaxID=60492 RepID=A0A9N9E703_9GLOM|nr:2880_t:CDS:2 [Racocetra fulgida]
MTGAAYSQIIDSVYAKHEYEYVANYKVLQTAFDKHKVDKTIPVERLVKCKFQDNLEFLQWMKRYWDTYYPGGPYDAVARRSTAAGPVKAVSGGGIVRTMPKRTTPTASAGGRVPTSGLHDNSQTSIVNELNKENLELKQTIDGLEKERDFYFGKLRDIEILVQQRIDSEPDNQLLKDIQSILYSTEDGFEVPPEGAVQETEYDDETF